MDILGLFADTIIINLESVGENLSNNENENENIKQNVESLGTPEIPPDDKSPIQCITIVGQVEGHMILGDQTKATKYEHIIPLLMAIEESKEVKGFIVILNTMGGDVEAGLAIAEMISGMSTPSVSLVLGGGHSIGITLATSADKSYIAPTATMMIHPVRMNGVVIGVEQTYNYLRRMQERIIKFVCSHSDIDEDTLLKLMNETEEISNDTGTVLIGQEAVDYGLIDSVGTISMCIEDLKEMFEE